MPFEPAVCMTTDLRERVASACRVLGTLDLTPGTLGHASARIPGTDRILVRARGPAESGVRYTTAGGAHPHRTLPLPTRSSCRRSRPSQDACTYEHL